MRKIDFYGIRKRSFIVAAALIVACIICSFVMGVSLDIQFKGGVIIKYSFEGDIDSTSFANKAEEILNTEVSAQINTGVNNMRQITLNIAGDESITSNTKEKLDDALFAAFPDNKLESTETANVAANMGHEFILKSVLAVLVAAVFMLLYVWIRFRKIGGLSAGSMALVALLIDVSMAYFGFVVFRIPLNDNFIAVILTILGYSINDTIVIFDRIRENEKLLGKKYPIDELVTKSLNQSFGRTLNTSICTFAVIAVLAGFSLYYNLDSITSFAVPMMFGIASGFFTSTFVSSPLWATWIKHKQAKQTDAKVNA